SIYGWAVDRIDAGVARIMEASDRAFGAGNYTLIVTADHGGHQRTHGTDQDVDMRIPWIVWGKGAVPGAAVTDPVNTMDTAATVAWLLGAAGPPDWAGTPVAAAFEPTARAA